MATDFLDLEDFFVVVEVFFLVVDLVAFVVFFAVVALEADFVLVSFFAYKPPLILRDGNKLT